MSVTEIQGKPHSGLEAKVLDHLMAAYSYLPHHPGRGALVHHLIGRITTDGASKTCRRMGLRFECDLSEYVDRHIYYGILERRDVMQLARFVRPGQVVLDVGANVGYYSLLFAKWMKATGVVHSFEPFAATANRLRRNLELNPALKGTIQVHEIALSDRVGTVSMTIPETGNSGRNCISNDANGSIPMLTLDAFVEREKLSRVDCIKVDVEGSEVAFLRGAAGTIRKYRPVIMIEIFSGGLGRYGFTPADVVELLGGWRYRLMIATHWGGLSPLTALPADQAPNVFAFPID